METNEIVALFKQHECPLDRDDVWKVQSAVVVKHKALERLAGALRIQWSAPQIIRAERDEAVILATGKLPEGAAEWSIGECLQTDGTKPGNYRISGKQAPYVYAMAEKRAKDRVILKLAGLHGAYSEDEADDFKQEPQRDERPATRPSAPALAQADPAGAADHLIELIKEAKNERWLQSVQNAPANIRIYEGLPDEEQARVSDFIESHRTKFARAA